MGSCCDIESQKQQKRNVLIAVFIINAIMFCLQFSAALIGHSTSLLADSLDMLGDAFTYGISIYVINKGPIWLSRAALFKGILILLFAIGIFFEAFIKIFFVDVYPQINIMIIFSLLALVANGSCFYLLTRHRDKDINMKSTWICARNDVIGNISILIAAGLIYVFNSRWPDIIIGCLLALILIKSAIQIIKSSLAR